MRIVNVQETKSVQTLGAPAPGGSMSKTKRKIKLSWEDLILAISLIVIIVSWIQGIFTADQVLAYLGFTATGGVWGYMTGSTKK
jgi:hypothetical protein